MEIKALHCSDIHLDARYSHIWNKGALKRQEQREIFAKICRTAKDERVDIVLIAGDLFELQRVNPDTVSFIKNEIMGIAPIPVFISPGNEDPYTTISPYTHSQWPSNTFIFNTNRFKTEEIPEKKIFLYGSANKTVEDKYQPLKNIQLKKKEGIHVAIFHGTDLQTRPQDKIACFPFTWEELKASRLHYVALGHFHDMEGIPADNPIAYYSGAPDYMKFDETKDKGIILSRISPQGSRITFVPTWKRRYSTQSVNCETFTQFQEIIEHIKRLSEDKNLGMHVVRIILYGYVREDLVIDAEKIEDAARDYFFHLVIQDETLTYYDLDRLAEEKTAKGEFVKDLRDSLSSLIKEDRQKGTMVNKALCMGLKAFSSRNASSP